MSIYVAFLKNGTDRLVVELSQREIIQTLKGIQNIKHKAILFLTYSAGLRVSEVVRLKVHDIDSDRQLIRIEQGKGRKSKDTKECFRPFAPPLIRNTSAGSRNRFAVYS